MTVALVSHHRKALSATERRAAADAVVITSAEEFDVVQVRAGEFGLRTVAGKFLSVAPNGTVTADSTWLREWETFRLVPANDGRFGILTFHETFLSASRDGELVCERWLREWEEFYLHVLPGADSLSGDFQDTSALQAAAIFDQCRARAAESAAAARELVGSMVFPNPYAAGRPD